MGECSAYRRSSTARHYQVAAGATIGASTRLRGVSATVTLEPWGSGDLPLLERLMGDPRMTEHLGGPESPDKLRERQSRYERLEGGDRMFKIVDVASGAGVGSVGFWTKEWRDEQSMRSAGWSCRSSRAAASRWRRRRQRAVERDLPQARLRTARRVGVRIPEGALHDLQRLAPGPAPLVENRHANNGSCGAGTRTPTT
jgi:hypothetical protein